MLEREETARKETLKKIKMLVKDFKRKGLIATFFSRDCGQWECILILSTVICGPGTFGLNKWRGEGKGVEHATKAAIQHKKKCERMLGENNNLIFYW